MYAYIYTYVYIHTHICVYIFSVPCLVETSSQTVYYRAKPQFEDQLKATLFKMNILDRVYMYIQYIPI